MRRFSALVIAALIFVPGSAHAVTYTVDPTRGSDRAPGTSSRPLRTVSAAWQRIPARTTLRAPVTIRLRAGRYPARSLPNYWESRWGTAAAPITILGPAKGTASLAAVNLFDLRHVRFRRLTFKDRFDLFHCEQCRSIEVRDSKLLGSRRTQHETVKINQSRGVTITRSVIKGADDNAIDLVAVRDAVITHNTISDAGDWCVYAKGGSADVEIRRNVISRCGTGGVTAGQGTGLQFMVAPFTHYEAYRVRIVDNDVSAVDGAAFGVNGGYQVTISGNRAYDVGARSHWIEVVFGLRSCDGRPGDEGRERCAALLTDGAWGTTRVDDGDNAVRIPNRHVLVAGNVIDQPAGRGDQLFSVAESYDGASQIGSGVGVARTTDLQVRDNRFAGRGLPSGLPDGSPVGANALDAPTGLFRSPRSGRRLVPVAGMPPTSSVAFTDDAPTPAED